jgi:hypothetical protein
MSLISTLETMLNILGLIYTEVNVVSSIYLLKYLVMASSWAVADRVAISRVSKDKKETS